MIQDGYKIISFAPDEDEIDGCVLDLVCRDPANPGHVSDEFLKWYYQQSILANMRGVGEPIFEVESSNDGLDESVVEPPQLEIEIERRLQYAIREKQISSNADCGESVFSVNRFK